MLYDDLLSRFRMSVFFICYEILGTYATDVPTYPYRIRDICIIFCRKKLRWTLNKFVIVFIEFIDHMHVITNALSGHGVKTDL